MRGARAANACVKKPVIAVSPWYSNGSGGIVTQASSVRSTTISSTLARSKASANRPASSRSEAECGSRARSRTGGVLASSVARARWRALLTEVSVVSIIAATSEAR